MLMRYPVCSGQAAGYVEKVIRVWNPVQKLKSTKGGAYYSRLVKEYVAMGNGLVHIAFV